jgi:aryl-alcohol dehydrogenase-like predicted oxidoreductase
MAETALRYVISHPAQPVAIPGAKSPAQAEMNARAGDKVLATEDFVRLQKLLD